MRILWFRRDLRINDNHLLSFSNDTVLPIFIFDKELLGDFSESDPRVTFIFNAVINLKKELIKYKMNLSVFYGKVTEVFSYLKGKGFNKVYFSCDYDNYAVKRDRLVSEIMEVCQLQDNFLFHPSEVNKKDGNPYKVFTPFYNYAKKLVDDDIVKNYSFIPSYVVENIDYSVMHVVENENVYKQDLDITSIDFKEHYINNRASKQAPESLLERIGQVTSDYSELKDYPYEDATSHIGLHLRFGTISVREVVRYLFDLKNQGFETEPFYRQIFWREFFNTILYNFPHSETDNFKNIFIPWENSTDLFEKWKSGTTGVPIVDAAMRQLNETGFMHNRLRMISASFLTKDLHIDWKWGEEYFRQKLFDYEASSNIASWQWAASTGTDAQPYFRVFNPYLQSKKFDKNADFIKTYLPETQNIPAEYLHSEDALNKITIENYPKPICDHKTESRKSIEIFRKSKKRDND